MPVVSRFVPHLCQPESLDASFIKLCLIEEARGAAA